ncbi:hypothetical protein [Magnetococcus sp. PR-3]|uniref:hypothetical protein n=1 Tax=Magnetococcus sp. PR-3 TaxID=3120355 RepID=UPI002FCE4623
MDPTLKAMLALGAVVLVVWAVLLPSASRGYGYSGYGGHYRHYSGVGGSIFGHRGTGTSWGSGGNVRTGSINGARTSGRGLRGGK